MCLCVIYRHFYCDFFNPALFIKQFVSSSANRLSSLVVPCIYFFSINSIPKYLAYSGKYSPYLLSELINNICFTLACINSSMKYNWCTLALLLEVYAKKCFRFLIDSIGDQLSPMISLLFKSPLTTIINFNLSRIPSYWIFPCIHPCKVSLDLPSLGHPLEMSDCLLNS